MWDSDDEEFEVVRNGRGQYSIWPGDRAVPAGWVTQGVRGNREACLAAIDELWADLKAVRSEGPVR